jgi:pimeloyl-ACP methyl ester carboxylesterase
MITFQLGERLQFQLRQDISALGPAGGVPLVFCHRFHGTMDDWDPAVVDALAAERRVILFDNAGIGLSTGKTPDSVKGMADRVSEFIRLNDFKPVDAPASTAARVACAGCRRRALWLWWARPREEGAP